MKKKAVALIGILVLSWTIFIHFSLGKGDRQELGNVFTAQVSPIRDVRFGVSADYPIFQLDSPMRTLVPREFFVMFTAFSIFSPINVSAYFVVEGAYVCAYSDVQDYFVNHFALIDATMLLNNTQYNLVFVVLDGLLNSYQETFQVEVDPIVPVIISLELSREELFYQETIEVEYVVEEKNFDRIEIYVDNVFRDTWYLQSGVGVLSWDMFVLPEGFTEKYFDLKFVVYDLAGNTAEFEISVYYYDDRWGFIDPEKYKIDTRNAIIVGVFSAVGFFASGIIFASIRVKNMPQLADGKPSASILREEASTGISKIKVSKPGKVASRLSGFGRKKK